MRKLKTPCNLHTPTQINSSVCLNITTDHHASNNSLTEIEEDENEAIDKSNIMRGSRLRHAKPQTSNKYNEGPDEDDVPAAD